MSLVDLSKLDIRGGDIHFKLYQQDGSLQSVTCQDTPSKRQLVAWIQVHDRYTPAEEIL